MKTLAIWIFTLLTLPVRADDYTRATDACKTCGQFEKLLQSHSAELSSDARLKIALEVAKVIQGIHLKGKPKLEQKREIYFAINASIQVQPDDFDAETAVRLLDLRPQAPAVFDDVLWHFTRGQQEKLIERMRAFKEDKVRPNAVIPVVKELN